MGNLKGILPENWAAKAKKDAEPKPVEVQIMEAMASAGIESPSHISIDGEIHRFKTTGKDRSGWYVFYPEGLIAGAFGDWKEGVELNFCADSGREFTAAEREESRRKIAQAKIIRDKEKKERNENAAEQARQIWDRSQKAGPKHPVYRCDW